MTYDEHLTWCKTTALEYLDAGDLPNAVASFGSDITKHEQGMRSGSPTHTILMQLGMMHVIAGDSAAVRRWIEEFR